MRFFREEVVRNYFAGGFDGESEMLIEVLYGRCGSAGHETRRWRYGTGRGAISSGGRSLIVSGTPAGRRI